jgi:hypothetical protein
MSLTALLLIPILAQDLPFPEATHLSEWLVDAAGVAAVLLVFLKLFDHFKRKPSLEQELNPRAYYLAMRWDYVRLPKEALRNGFVRLSVPGADDRHVFARPVDFGPGDGSVIDGAPTRDTGRLADLSPGAATALGLQTDDLVVCEWVG